MIGARPAQAPHQSQQPAPGRKAAFLLLLFFCVFLFGGLGYWQLERMAWKQDLIAKVEARATADALPLPGTKSWDGLNVETLEYQRVSFTGVFDYSAEVQTLAVTELGPGFWVVTPLRLEGGGTVLVNRGFVPTALRDAANRPASPTPTEVKITGLLRRSEPDGGFLRDNDPARMRWYSRDVEAIARAQQIQGPVAPFFVDASLSAKETLTPDDPGYPHYPRGGLTVIAFRNTHLVYALTWFTLAAMGSFGIYLTLRSR